MADGTTFTVESILDLLFLPKLLKATDVYTAFLFREPVKNKLSKTHRHGCWVLPPPRLVRVD